MNRAAGMWLGCTRKPSADFAMRESITETEWRRMLPVRRREFDAERIAALCGCGGCWLDHYASAEPPPALKMLFAGKRPAIMPHLFGFSTPDEDEE